MKPLWSPTAPRLSGSSDIDADLTLLPTEEVFEADEPTYSMILGPDGEPIPYISKKLGYIGFLQLKERCGQ